MNKMPGARVCLFFKWENGIYSLGLEFTIKETIISGNHIEILEKQLNSEWACTVKAVYMIPLCLDATKPGIVLMY